MTEPPPEHAASGRLRAVVRSVLAYLNFERPHEPVPPPRPTAFGGIKLAWAAAGLLGAAWVLWGGAAGTSAPGVRCAAGVVLRRLTLRTGGA